MYGLYNVISTGSGIVEQSSSSSLFPLPKYLWEKHEMIPSASKLKSSKWCRLSALTLAGSQCRTTLDSKTIVKVTGNHSTSFSKNS